MKHKFLSLMLAIVASTVTMFADVNTVATVEKLWASDPLGWTTTDSRQWTGHGEYVYWCSKANHAIYGTRDGVNVETIIVNDAIDGTAFCVDDAGNWIVEGVFPNTPSHVLLVKHADTSYVDIPVAGLGRTDIVTATGDVFSAEGGTVFLYGNSVNLLALAIKNAGTQAQEVKVKEIAITGGNVQNYVVAGDTLEQYVQRRSMGQTGFDHYVNGANQGTVAGMTGYKNSTLSGALVVLAGDTFAIYPCGSVNYSSEFAVLNLSKGIMAVDKADATKTTFYANTTTRANGNNVGAFVHATKIDNNNAYIQLGNGSDGTALFKLTVTVSAEVTVECDEAQGTVTGGGSVAVGANATVEATAKPGYEFVCWRRGDVIVDYNAKYTFTVNENTALTAIFEAKPNVTVTLAVNDAAKGSITLPEGMAMGENSVVYGTELVLTAVPAEGAAFIGWFSGDLQYAKEAEITLNGKESLSLIAKFVNVLHVAYELNGGITNDYNWTNASDMFADFMADAQASNLTYTLADYLAMVEKLAAPTGICVYLNNPEKAFANSAKWGWLKTYIASVHVAQADAGASVLPDNGAGAAWRYAVGAFFIDGQRNAWPVSADFTDCGVSTVDAYQPEWQHGFANPTEVIAEVTLNAPYKEGYTFVGWYATADFSGEKYVTLDPETVVPGNKLYAAYQVAGEDDPTDVTNAQAEAIVMKKIIRNGQLLIIRDGKTFTLQGQEVK